MTEKPDVIVRTKVKAIRCKQRQHHIRVVSPASRENFLHFASTACSDDGDRRKETLLRSHRTSVTGCGQRAQERREPSLEKRPPNQATTARLQFERAVLRSLLHCTLFREENTSAASRNSASLLALRVHHEQGEGVRRAPHSSTEKRYSAQRRAQMLEQSTTLQQEQNVGQRIACIESVLA